MSQVFGSTYVYQISKSQCTDTEEHNHRMQNMATTSRALEVTIISGEGLRVDRRRPVKKNAFVVVRTNSQNSRSTKADFDGGSFPAWNEKLVVEMPAHTRFLTVEVRCKVNSGDKVVGTAKIPASDFAGGYCPPNYLHFLSYRLRDSCGGRNGIINLSVRVKGTENVIGAATCAAEAASSSRPWVGGSAVVGKLSGEIVIGVPVRMA